MPVPFKKDPVEFNQRKLLAEDVFDLLDKDHDCFIYEDILSQIDTKSIEEKFSMIGQACIPSKESDSNTNICLQPGNI